MGEEENAMGNDNENDDSVMGSCSHMKNKQKLETGGGLCINQELGKRNVRI